MANTTVSASDYRCAGGHNGASSGHAQGAWRPGRALGQPNRCICDALPGKGGRTVGPRKAALLTGLFAGLAFAVASAGVTPAHASNPQKPAISEEASAALARMGATLQGKQFSFQARTLRVYANQNGELLHIAHQFRVTIRRPDRL